MPSLRGEPPHGAFALVVSAYPPHADGAAMRALLHREAIVALGRAVFAKGATVAVLGDGVVAPLLAQVALEYAVPPRTESRERSSAPLAVLEAGERDSVLRSLFWPYIARGSVAYVDAEGRMVALDSIEPMAWNHHVTPPVWADPGTRDPWTPTLLQRVREVVGAEIVGAVIIGGTGPDADRDSAILSSATSNLAILEVPGDSDGDSHAARLLREVDERRVDDRGERARPYTYIAQRLIDDWTGLR